MAMDARLRSVLAPVVPIALAICLILVLSGVMRSGYLLRWRNVPGDSEEEERLVDYLRDTLGQDWDYTARIVKVDNDEALRVSSGANWAELRLDRDRRRARLSSSNGTARELPVREVEGALNVYRWELPAALMGLPLLEGSAEELRLSLSAKTCCGLGADRCCDTEVFTIFLLGTLVVMVASCYLLSRAVFGLIEEWVRTTAVGEEERND